ncbi:MAG: 30S ribosomal protein S3, partial [Candidatus Accumulibacter sp.]|nr:30S ribosomal protein S3 [Accumulibacter sp.]
IIGVKVWVFKGEILNRDEQPEAAPETPTEEPGRKPRRVAKPAGEGDKPKRVAGKRKDEGQAASAEPAPEAKAKAPAKRVRKAGTTDASAN